MALAIMNVGQYAKAPVRPSGDIVLTIQNQSTLGSTIEEFATNGSIIVGITYNKNSIFMSNDEGVTWQQIALEKNVIDVYYSETTSKFYVLEAKTSGKILYYGESTDAVNWTWNALTEAPNDDVRGHKVDENANGIVCYYIRYGQYVSEQIEDNVITGIGGSAGTSTYKTATLDLKTRNGIQFRASTNVYYTFNTNGYISSGYIMYNQYQKSRMGRVSYGKRGNTAVGTMYPYELYVSDDFSTQVIYATPPSSSQITEFPMGYFELNGVFYVFSQTRIAKGDNIQGIMDIFYEEAYDIADMANLREILHLEGQHILLSADGGKIYKCTLT